MIYTSYYGNAKELQKHGIEIVSVSRGKPKGFQGRSIDSLAPTWSMLSMSDEEYDIAYDEILKRNNANDIVAFLGKGDVALCCWEKDVNMCHRLKIANWLKSFGYEVEEFFAGPIQLSFL